VAVLHAYSLHAPVAELVNEALLAGSEHPWAAFAWHVDHALERLPVRRAVLYRAVRMPRETLGKLLEQYEKGAVVLWNTFVSATTELNLAAPWLYDDDKELGNVTVLFRMRCHSARRTAEFSLHETLDEHVLPRNTVFSVSSVHAWRKDAAQPHTKSNATSDVSKSDAAFLSPTAFARNACGVGDVLRFLQGVAPARDYRDVLKGENVMVELDEMQN
jgi:hypothetical protein